MSDGDRIVPTREGWWWLAGERSPVKVERVGKLEVVAGKPTVDNTALWGIGQRQGPAPVTDPRFSWLAPVPSSAASVALAEYGASLAGGIDSHERERRRAALGALRSVLLKERATP